MNESTLTPGTVSALLAAWWFHYDEWNPAELRALMADDIAFTCASDTGATDYEDFIRVDVRGADDVMAWKDDQNGGQKRALEGDEDLDEALGVSDKLVVFVEYGDYDQQ